MKTLMAIWFSAISAISSTATDASVENTIGQDAPEVTASWKIGRVPSGFPVRFSLLTRGHRQFVAFYDAQHRMTVASRTLDSDEWKYKVLPSIVPWDSHNYVTMAADDGGYLHLSGNMHCVPLIYFRTDRPWDITTFRKVDAMVGRDEGRCTYPKFMRGPQGELIFHYRDGASGRGNEIFNAYDVPSRTWRRLIDQPLIDGKGEMNAYLSGPNLGPDGWFHLAWIWRDTPDCETNHTPSYARSRDLLAWETIDGQRIELPITYETPGTVIDPVPPFAGILNGSLHIGFDSSDQPLASYHKFDEEGNTQVYVARFEEGAWVSRQVSQWAYRWDFRGRGSIPFEIILRSFRPHSQGRLALPYDHIQYGQGLLVIDEQTLEFIGTEPQPVRYPPALSEPQSDIDGMAVRWAEDDGGSNEPGVRYVLRWETLPVHRDRQREGDPPEPSPLVLYKLSTQP